VRIAVIGGGISGLLSARLLDVEHEVTLFEAGNYAGGHTNTVAVDDDGQQTSVDTGFIVYNERTYPNFVRLLEILGVASKPAPMTFSVHCDRTGFEYGTASLRAILAQPANLFRPGFHRMLRDVLRFHHDAPELLEGCQEQLSLGEWLQRQDYSKEFVDRFLVPMGASIWSMPPSRMIDFPASVFVRFFHNHGLLSLRDQPQWRVVEGGSARYVERLIAPMRDRIRLGCAARKIRRTPDGVEIATEDQKRETFDRVVVATHSDQALRMLADPTTSEQEILGAIPYHENVALLHTDERLLPRSRSAWSAWNYRIADELRPASVTYDMNILQGFDSRQTFCVTLNDEQRIDPRRILRKFVYQHPLFTAQAIAAQSRRKEISGVGRTYYAGAYWGYGFHEDGVRSALAVASRFGIGLDHLLPEHSMADGGRLAS
jgi:uncharacterized protein